MAFFTIELLVSSSVMLFPWVISGKLALHSVGLFTSRFFDIWYFGSLLACSQLQLLVLAGLARICLLVVDVVSACHSVSAVGELWDWSG